MRLKNLFTVSNEQKVTDKLLRRVLISSICSILLCMACLASTTWAWFTVSIENRDNEIQIATVTANVTIQDGNGNEVSQLPNGDYALAMGNYTVEIKLDSDAAEPKSAVYVLMTVMHDDKPQYYYVTVKGPNKEATQPVTVGSGTATVDFSVSWVKPASADPVAGETVVIGEMLAALTPPPTEATTLPPTEAATEPATEPVTQPVTEPVTQPATEPATDQTTETAVETPEN